MQCAKINNRYFGIKLADTLNVTNVGEPVINYNMLSGFSDDDYVVLPNSFSPGSNTWEFVTKIKIARYSQNNNDRQTIIARNTATRSFQLTYYEDKTIAFSLSFNGSSNSVSEQKSTHTFDINKWYWIKLEKKTGSYVLSFSLDGLTWTSTKTYSSSSNVYSAVLRMGSNYYTTEGNIYGQVHEPFSGEIDMSQTYIKINGTVTWNGVSSYKYYGTMPYIESDGNGQYINISSLYTPVYDDIITVYAQTPDYLSITTTVDDPEMFGYIISDNSYNNSTNIAIYKSVWTSKYSGQHHDFCAHNGSGGSIYSDYDGNPYGNGDGKFMYSETITSVSTGTRYIYKLFDEVNSFKVRIWNVNIVRNGTTIVNLCAAKQNNVVGVKDTISGTFLSNSGTGTLTIAY